MASIAALLFINQKGEVVISRMYRDGFSRSVADTFRTQILGNKDDMRSPVKVIGDTCFMYIKHGNMYVVAVASGNAQAAGAAKRRVVAHGAERRQRPPPHTHRSRGRTRGDDQS